MAETLVVAKSTIWYILKKKECPGELIKTKSSVRPQNTYRGRKTPSQHLARVRKLSGKQAYHCHNVQSRDAFMNLNTECLPQCAKTFVNSHKQRGQIRLRKKTCKKACSVQD